MQGRGGSTAQATSGGLAGVYDAEVRGALKKGWYLFGCVCGKRLEAILPQMVPLLEKFGELRLDAEIRDKQLQISAAGIDRLLSAEKRKLRLRGRSYTTKTT